MHVLQNFRVFQALYINVDTKINSYRHQFNLVHGTKKRQKVVKNEKQMCSEETVASPREKERLRWEQFFITNICSECNMSFSNASQNLRGRGCQVPCNSPTLLVQNNLCDLIYQLPIRYYIINITQPKPLTVNANILRNSLSDLVVSRSLLLITCHT